MAMAKERQQLDRLREEQIKAVEDTKQRIHQMQKYAQDYKCLQERLKTLPDKVSQNVMVPFGKLAFMPGVMVHTNEILVLLGDNWFTERSATQASDIASRRVKAIDEQISDLEKQMGLLQPRLDFTTQMEQVLQGEGDIREIKEEYSEEEDRRWRVEHRARVRAHKEHLRQQREKAAALTTQAPPSEEEESHAALWQRLDELESQETRNREMLRPLSEEDSPRTLLSSLPEQVQKDFQKYQSRNSESNKGVRWKDEEPGSSHSEEPSGTESEDETESGEEIEGNSPSKRPVNISFKHSHCESQTKTGTSYCGGATGGELSITSPTDIYHTFVEPYKDQPKSILKTPSTKFKAQKQPTKSQKNKIPAHIATVGPEPFSGSVVERTAPQPEPFTGTIIDKTASITDVNHTETALPPGEDASSHVLPPGESPQQPELFTGAIIEKPALISDLNVPPGEGSSSTVVPPVESLSPVAPSSESQGTSGVVPDTGKKRVSKFKASRQKHSS